MVVTRSGVTGDGVASHVMEERNVVIVHATIPRHHTVAETAGNWDKLSKHGDATHINAQCRFMAIGALGANGPRAQGAVDVVSCQSAERALIQFLRMRAVDVQGPLLSHNLVTAHHAKLMVTGQLGANGPSARRHVEAVTEEGAELVPTQPLRMVACPAKGPAIS